MSLQFGDQPVWNPFPHFYNNGTWPRGHPWEHLPETLNVTGTENQTCLPVIQQYLTLNEPDYDAAFLNMKTFQEKSINESRTSFKTLVGPRNVFAPYNSHVSIFYSLIVYKMSIQKEITDLL